MKLAIFFSAQSEGYLHHFLRLRGFLKQNPQAELTWVDLSNLNCKSRYHFSKFDKWILLAEESSLNPSQRNWLTQHQVRVETLPISDAIHAEEVPFLFKQDHLVYVPSSKNSRRRNLDLWKEFNKQMPALYWCPDVKSLEGGAPPGVSTLFSPVFPETHLRALSSAAIVVSAAWEPCLAARANGVYSVKLSDGKREANPWEIPELVVGNRSAKEIVQDCFKLFGEFQPIKSDFKPRLSSEWKPKFNLTSISDFTYLPFLIGMIENVFAQSGEIPGLHVLALDKKVRPFLEKRYGSQVRVYELSELWNPQELQIIEKRAVGFQAFSSKPRLLEKVLHSTRLPTFHCDSDIFFFSPPEDLLSTFQEGSVVLFPHWNDEFPKGRADGLYNAGMIGVRPGGERFLHWWSDQCLAECTFDPENGMVGDQAYLDFVPILFEGVTIHKKKDHNIARWNLETLGIGFSENRNRLQNKENRLVKTFHAAFIDSLGFFEFKYCWDQVAAFFSGFFEEGKSSEFSKNTLVQQQRYWLTLSRSLKLQKWWGPSKKEPLKEPSLFWIHGWGREGLAWPLKLKGLLGSLPFLSIHR